MNVVPANGGSRGRGEDGRRAGVKSEKLAGGDASLPLGREERRARDKSIGKLISLVTGAEGGDFWRPLLLCGGRQQAVEGRRGGSQWCRGLRSGELKRSGTTHLRPGRVSLPLPLPLQPGGPPEEPKEPTWGFARRLRGGPVSPQPPSHQRWASSVKGWQGEERVSSERHRWDLAGLTLPLTGCDHSHITSLCLHCHILKSLSTLKNPALRGCNENEMDAAWKCFVPRT